jgi:acyl-coenzyme A synthetase/AMP-(fatty) acid ligase
MDEEGFLYFIGRRDEMMKTSGYRVSPTEVEEVIYATRLVGECVAFGVDHPTLGQAIQVIATPQPRATARYRPPARRMSSAGCPPTWCRRVSVVRHGPLPRNPNGKIDRKAAGDSAPLRVSRPRSSAGAGR